MQQYELSLFCILWDKMSLSCISFILGVYPAQGSDILTSHINIKSTFSFSDQEGYPTYPKIKNAPNSRKFSLLKTKTKPPLLGVYHSACLYTTHAIARYFLPAIFRMIVIQITDNLDVYAQQGLDFIPSRENHIWFSPDSFARINWFSFYDKIHNTAESNCYAN